MMQPKIERPISKSWNLAAPQPIVIYLQHDRPPPDPMQPCNTSTEQRGISFGLVDVGWVSRGETSVGYWGKMPVHKGGVLPSQINGLAGGKVLGWCWEVYGAVY